MTEQQAIKAIQNDLEWHSKELKPAYKEVLRMAIQALEEIQQYRAIGLTPELIEAMQGHNIALINDLGEYQAIGTVEQCRTAVERMKPKKPTNIAMVKDRKICVGRIGKCPCCGSAVAEDNFTCKDCFQVLDWTE